MALRNIPKEARSQAVVLLLCGVSVSFFVLIKAVPFREADVVRSEMLHASQIMARAVDAISACRSQNGIEIDEKHDPNRSGLIGVEFSLITTSRGSLEAKRTTTNPNMAGLVVFLLREAGVAPGDSIAVGASGSFPALIVATLAAAKAMQVKPVAIYSLGASQWGANVPGFHWLHIESCLEKNAILETGTVAVSLGGDGDAGGGMDPEARLALESAVATRGIQFLREPDLKRNVEARRRLYEEGGDGIKAFVHIGGAWANIGEAVEILDLEPGLAQIDQLPPPDQRGVLFEMAAGDVPVIHLLFVKGLVERYGLPWDPKPLPDPGEGELYRRPRIKDPRFLAVAATYLLLVSIILFFRGRLELISGSRK